ncbi:dihydroflavonol-4-reductase [Cordyceps fumosorosea ARSEF 2679]|uniref:Dihydroflavonol-4-reductase n=1 Tax=Cordyceps fumosorosea (strain ARSEF 2679) TaxID=1081104 RepID=A0A167M8F1_CORFA|nr:dihydroflavonol-4-reductase [Cordyceps fumosorosea ARSEF 2679]OAA54063.1 dihydroflavonol-4-reductase [Cordyceps fumosorosea ARSEF 2679]
MANDRLVLVTGGSGFIALHIIHKLLQAGYKVRTTVRSLERADDIRYAMRSAGVGDKLNDMEFVVVDLLRDAGWDAACAGADYVLHTASPFPSAEPKDENELIKPAREGTLRALRAAKKAGSVKRVVVTSSAVAVMYGHAQRSAENPFTEKDWTEIRKPKSYVGAYPKSKTIAERAAWDWLAGEGQGSFELATVNPVLVYGPSLGKSVNTSLEVPMCLLSGEMSALPDLHIGIVDVRDVADLHVLVLESPKAPNQRYLAISDEMSVPIKQMAADLKKHLPAEDTTKLPTGSAPSFMIRLIGLFNKRISVIVPELGHVRPVSNAKARKELGWRPRSATEALIASVESLKANGKI